MPATLTSKHDSAGWRKIPTSSKPINQDRVQELLVQEWARFEEATKASGVHNKKAMKSLPNGRDF